MSTVKFRFMFSTCCWAGSVFRQCHKIAAIFIENVMADVWFLCCVVA